MSVQALAGKFMELSAHARACCSWGCTTDIERRHHMKRVAFLRVARGGPTRTLDGRRRDDVWHVRAAPHGRNKTW